MKRILTIIVLFIFTIGFFGCEKFAEDTPQAVKKLIRQNKGRGGQVTEYEYNNENIYCWSHPGCADCFADYYDKNANLLWQTGGFTGKGDGNMPEDFGEKTIFKRIVWTAKITEKYLEEQKN